jgi:hypothetical protein
MKLRLSLQCMECYQAIADGPLRPATVSFLNTLAAEHVCATDAEGKAGSSGAMTPEEIQALIDGNKVTSQ